MRRFACSALTGTARSAPYKAAMRVLAAVLVVGSIAVLAAIQLLSSVTLHAVAQRGSWVATIPPEFAAAVERRLVPLPLPPALRLVLARRALADGDPALAERQLIRLPQSEDRFALQADLAERRGDSNTAVRDYLAAGDRAGLERHITLLEERGDVAAALVLEHQIVDRLERERGEQDALADAYFALGRLEQVQAYRFPVASVRRRAHAGRASDAYARAVALAPFRERYLLGFANQQLNLGDDRAAVAAFERAHLVDPTIAGPLVGLADAAFRRGDREAMRSYIARARALDPASPDLRRLLAKLRP